MTDRIIDNTGSAARDHLANERTFLSWVRTALGLVGLGVVVGQVVEDEGVAAQLGSLVLIAYGAVMLLYAVRRYKHVADQLGRGGFPVASRGPVVLGLVALVVTLGAVVFVLL